MTIPLFLVGRLYGWTWREAVGLGGLSTVMYVVLLAHSIFLTQQDMDAMLHKVLYIASFGWVVWTLLVKGDWLRARRLVLRRRTGAMRTSDGGGGADAFYDGATSYSPAKEIADGVPASPAILL
jgi:hypothetical protein